MCGEMLRIKSKTLEYERSLSFIFNDSTNSKNNDDEGNNYNMLLKFYEVAKYCAQHFK